MSVSDDDVALYADLALYRRVSDDYVCPFNVPFPATGKEASTDDKVQGKGPIRMLVK